MSTKLSRTTITIPNEWESELRSLKQEQFYDKSKSELLRYLIQQGLEQIRKSKATQEKPA